MFDETSPFGKWVLENGIDPNNKPHIGLAADIWEKRIVPPGYSEEEESYIRECKKAAKVATALHILMEKAIK